MKKKTEYSATRDCPSRYPDNSPRPFIYKDTDSIRAIETVKKIRVLDYGKFETTKIRDLSSLQNSFRRTRSLFMSCVVHGESYPIMVRTTADGFGVVFWSSYGTEKIFFTLIDDEIECHIERVTPKA